MRRRTKGHNDSKTKQISRLCVRQATELNNMHHYSFLLDFNDFHLNYFLINKIENVIFIDFNV